MNSFTWGNSQKGQTLINLDGHEFQKKNGIRRQQHTGAAANRDRMKARKL